MPPKVLSRVTKHKKPLYQLYQPGFNSSNSCWLEGAWVSIPQQEWLARKDAHEANYQRAFKARGDQHYRDKGTPVSEMTPEQKQAYDHYSGDTDLYVMRGDAVQPCRVPSAGGKVSAKGLKWLRDNEYKVIAKVLNPNSTEPVDQVTEAGIPADLTVFTDGPMDVWANIVEANKARSREMFYECLEGIGTMPIPGMGDMAAGMACQFLIEMESEIFRQTQFLANGEKPDPYTNLEIERPRYAQMRKDLEAKGLMADYERVKATQNSCNEHNGSPVIPKFNPDGTHE